MFKTQKHAFPNFRESKCCFKSPVKILEADELISTGILYSQNKLQAFMLLLFDIHMFTITYITIFHFTITL